MESAPGPCPCFQHLTVRLLSPGAETVTRVSPFTSEPVGGREHGDLDAQGFEPALLRVNAEGVEGKLSLRREDLALIGGLSNGQCDRRERVVELAVLVPAPRLVRRVQVDRGFLSSP